MPDTQVDNTPQYIENLIKKQKNYPYYYWVVWIFFLVVFAVVLSVHACQSLKIDNSCYIGSNIKIQGMHHEQQASAPNQTIF